MGAFLNNESVMKSTSRIIFTTVIAVFLRAVLTGAAAAVPNGAEATDPSAGAPVAMTVRFELFVKDTHVSAEFYSRVLGFQCDTDAGPYIRATSGSVRIGICDQSTLGETHHFSPTAMQGQKGAGTEIVLEVENLDALHERVVKSGYAIREELMKRPWGLRDFRIVDPDGYYLRITEKTANGE